MNWLKAQIYETPQHFEDPGNPPEFISGPSDADSIFDPNTNATEEEKRTPGERILTRVEQLIEEKEWDITSTNKADFLEIENLQVDEFNNNYIYDIIYYMYDENKELQEVGRKKRGWDKSIIDRETDY